jgi:hypothetical protein
MRLLAAVVIGSILAPALPACAFELAFEVPPFVVSVPRLPSISVGAPNASQGGNVLTVRGQDTTYIVEITATASGNASSTRTCAGAAVRELLGRPNMPDRDNVYRVPFDSNTFLVLYLLELGGTRLLHAHLLSAAGGTHCVDAHFSRSLLAGEDVDSWRTTFSGATVREASR